MNKRQSPLPEAQLAETLQRLDQLGQRKADLEHELAKVLEQIKEVALVADSQGAKIDRIVELGQINNRLFYRWRPAKTQGKPARTKNPRK